MPIIVLSRIFLKKIYGSNEINLVEETLTELCDEVRGTRKGRYWEVMKNNCLYDIDVRDTESKLYDYEDELLDMNLLPEDVPETILIVSNNVRLDREKNFNFVCLLSDALSTKLDGITNGAGYS